MYRIVVAIALLALYLNASQARAQTAVQDAPVTDCDKYAANSLDPQRKTAGVNFTQLNPSLAVPACESALQQFPNSARLSYQLARAYQRAGKFDAAATQYQSAMEHGSAFAEAGLGLLYMLGQGVRRDFSKAVSLFRESADKGVASAQNALGFVYAHGQGVTKDLEQSVTGYRKAAEQGVPNAQLNLGIAYEEGSGGVKQDFDQAAFWYGKAAAVGLEDARKRLAGIQAKKKSPAK